MSVQIVNESHLEHVIDLMRKYFIFYEKEPPSKEDLERHISTFYGGNSLGVQFISYDSDNPTGFATLYFTHSTLSLMPISIMNDLYIEENFRGKGVADLLFDRCIDYSKSIGIKKMEWVTANDNYRAKKFYNRKGGEGSEWTLYDIRF